LIKDYLLYWKALEALLIVLEVLSQCNTWLLHIQKAKQFLFYLSFELMDTIQFIPPFGKEHSCLAESSSQIIQPFLYRAGRDYLFIAGLHWNMGSSSGFKKKSEHAGSWWADVLEVKKSSKWFLEFWLPGSVRDIPESSFQAGSLSEIQPSGPCRWVIQSSGALC